MEDMLPALYLSREGEEEALPAWEASCYPFPSPIPSVVV